MLAALILFLLGLVRLQCDAYSLGRGCPWRIPQGLSQQLGGSGCRTYLAMSMSSDSTSLDSSSLGVLKLAISSKDVERPVLIKAIQEIEKQGSRSSNSSRPTTGSIEGKWELIFVSIPGGK